MIVKTLHVSMLKPWPARGSLFLFLRTHRHLEYYLQLRNARLAANQDGIGTSAAVPDKRTNVVELHPLARVRF